MGFPVNYSLFYLTFFGPPAVAGRVLWIGVCPSGIFLGIGSLVFSKTQHVARGLCVAVRDRAVFFEKLGQSWAKIGFFGFIWKFSHYFFLNLVYKENSCYLLYSCTNPILGKNLFPEIWAKILLAYQIAGFFNWLYLPTTTIKKPDFLHVDID